MKERDFQTKFKHFLEQFRFHKTHTFELKIEKSKSMRFDKVQRHQLRGLYDSKHKNLYWKLPDTGYVRKPFDCQVLAQSEAYVVIWFYHPREKKEMFWIDIDKYINVKFKNRHGRKSLKEEEWRSLSTMIFVFK